MLFLSRSIEMRRVLVSLWSGDYLFVVASRFFDDGNFFDRRTVGFVGGLEALEKMFDGQMRLFLQQLRLFVVVEFVVLVKNGILLRIGIDEILFQRLFVLLVLVVLFGGQFLQDFLHFRIGESSVELDESFDQRLSPLSFLVGTKMPDEIRQRSGTVTSDFCSSVSIVDGEERRLIVVVQNGIVSILKTSPVEPVPRERERSSVITSWEILHPCMELATKARCSFDSSLVS